MHIFRLPVEMRMRIYAPAMTPMLHIRKEVLGLNQQELATLTGTTQATVSRWEKGELEPNRDQLKAIRDEAARRGITWNDSWFFEGPAKAAAA
jgi:transcriptional regulator with XRE-family HTH domain